MHLAHQPRPGTNPIRQRFAPAVVAIAALGVAGCQLDKDPNRVVQLNQVTAELLTALQQITGPAEAAARANDLQKLVDRVVAKQRAIYEVQLRIQDPEAAAFYSRRKWIDHTALRSQIDAELERIAAVAPDQAGPIRTQVDRLQELGRKIGKFRK